MQSKMFPELGNKIDAIYIETNAFFDTFLRSLEGKFPNDKTKASKAIKVLEIYFKAIEEPLKTVRTELNNILNDTPQKESDQQLQDQNQFQTILDQLKNLIDSNNNNMIICIEQLQDIITGQAIAVNNLSDMLADLTNRVNLIAAGYTASLAKYIPDKTSQD